MERELAAEVAGRLGEPDPAAVRARLTAAAFLVTLRVSLNVWLDQPPGTRLWDVVRGALAETGRGFG